MLVTTREARIAEARIHSLDVMDEAQALALMTQKISEPLSEDERERAVEFAGGWGICLWRWSWRRRRLRMG